MFQTADSPAKDVAAGGTGAAPLTGRPPVERRERAADGGAGGHLPGDSPVGYAPSRRRRTSLAARGEPMVWLTGGAAGLAVVMIVGLLLLVAVSGFGTFWPAPVARVTYQPPDADAPRTLAGEQFRQDAFVYNEDADRDGVLDDGEDYNGDGVLQTELEVERTLYRTGNEDVTATRFTFVNAPDVREIEHPEWFLTLERDEYGRAYGEIEAVSVEGELTEGPAEAFAEFERVFPTVRALGEKLNAVKEEIGDLGVRQAEARDLRRAAADLEAEDPEAAAVLVGEAEAIEAEVGAEEGELNARVAELERQQNQYRLFVRTDGGEVLPASPLRKTFRVAPREVLAPEDADRVASARIVGRTRAATADDAPMGLDNLLVDGAAVAAEGSNPTVEFLDADGEVVGSYGFAPRALILPIGSEVSAGTAVAVEPLPLKIGQVVRAYPANRLSFLDKVGVYLGRWWEFLSDEPRDANMAGGVLPQIIGTVLLVFIMIVFAVPIGVVAAIYLREYATQGPLTSLVRISVNNLAGVPSIVYGVFGLGFFAYGVGGWLDQGAVGADVDPLGVGVWSLMLLLGLITALAAMALAAGAASFDRGAATLKPGDALPKVMWALPGLAVLVVVAVLALSVSLGLSTLFTVVAVGLAVVLAGWTLWNVARAKDRPERVPGLFKLFAGLAWAVAAGVVFYFVIASVPTGIFDGFNTEAAKAGQPVWNGPALIWASLTLALLTLPVVIVATEEALAAVPRSMREGSYACGASQWQTIRRIVLPRALPGIMTGAILAISRGAGEVAPIMLVGALKFVEDKPVGTEFPFLYADQSFMHLGFHIFDLGFHSPDAEAARPMVYTTTLLLIGIVLILNLSAIWVRSRLRRAFAGGQF